MKDKEYIRGQSIIGPALGFSLIAGGVLLAVTSEGWARLGLAFPVCLGAFIFVYCWTKMDGESRAYLITLFVAALIAVGWCWGHRSAYATDTLWNAWRSNGFWEGLHLWFISLNVWPWLLMLCFALPLPLILAGRPPRTLTLFGCSTVYFAFLTWCVDVSNDDNALELWYGWPLILRIATLAIPVATVMLGNRVIGAGAELLRPIRAGALCGVRTTTRVGMAVRMGPYAALNIGAIAAGVCASSWLRTKGMGPFFNGFWKMSCIALPAPSAVHRVLADPLGKWLAVAWGGTLGLAALALAVRTGRLKDVNHGAWIAFSVSGFFALWAVWDVLCNYTGLLTWVADFC